MRRQGTSLFQEIKNITARDYIIFQYVSPSGLHHFRSSQATLHVIPRFPFLNGTFVAQEPGSARVMLPPPTRAPFRSWPNGNGQCTLRSNSLPIYFCTCTQVFLSISKKFHHKLHEQPSLCVVTRNNYSTSPTFNTPNQPSKN